MMHCSHLSELPAPPNGRTGWPWTEETAPAPAAMPDGEAWPRISIVTPSYNQGQYLEETIRSILLQGYPNLEYLVIDGGSNDQSVEIIRKYAAWINHWESEPDRGAAHAIHKGFGRASADILAWLNSDDIYFPNALQRIACELTRRPDADVISGQCRVWCGKPDDELIGPSPLRKYKDFLRVGSNWMQKRLILQPEAFFRKRAYVAVGGLREDISYAFDVDLWMRFARAGFRFESIPVPLANLRLHPAQKTADPYVGYQDLCRLAWHHLKADWPTFGDEAVAIADDILYGMEQIGAHYQDQYRLVNNSTSYRLGRLVTQLRFW